MRVSYFAAADTIWLQKLGPGYIADTFRWAHQADPHVKLFLNDYNVEAGNAKRDAYFALVKDLFRQHVPIDAPKLQAQGYSVLMQGCLLDENFAAKTWIRRVA